MSASAADLRTTEPNWWRRGLPYEHAYCPRCRCNKSDHPEEPNLRTEACDDSACICHEEEA